MHGVRARTPVYFQSLISSLASLYYILDMTSPLWQLRQSKQRRVVREKWKQIFKFKSSHWNGIQETFEIRKYKFELIKEMLEIWSGQIQEYLNQHPWLQVQVHDHQSPLLPQNDPIHHQSEIQSGKACVFTKEDMSSTPTRQRGCRKHWQKLLNLGKSW